MTRALQSYARGVRILANLGAAATLALALQATTAVPEWCGTSAADAPNACGTAA